MQQKNTQQRKHLRQQFRSQRRAINDVDRQAWQLALHTNLNTVCASLSGHTTAYIAADGEVDLQLWMQSTHLGLALPKVGDKRTMTFHAWQMEDELVQSNQFEVWEPLANSQVIHPEQLAAVIVPLVAFDSSGTRLGMGGGFYDQFFAAHPQIMRIGVAFQLQQSATLLPREAWDMPLDRVVTEQTILDFAR